MNGSLRLNLMDGKVLRIHCEDGKFTTNLYIPRKEDKELIPGGDIKFLKPEGVLDVYGKNMEPVDIVKFRQMFQV